MLLCSISNNDDPVNVRTSGRREEWRARTHARTHLSHQLRFHCSDFNSNLASPISLTTISFASMLTNDCARPQNTHTHRHTNTQTPMHAHRLSTSTSHRLPPKTVLNARFTLRLTIFVFFFLSICLPVSAHSAQIPHWSRRAWKQWQEEGSLDHDPIVVGRHIHPVGLWRTRPVGRQSIDRLEIGIGLGIDHRHQEARLAERRTPRVVARGCCGRTRRRLRLGPWLRPSL